MRLLAAALTVSTAIAGLAFAPVPTGDDEVLDGATELPAGCVDDEDATYPFRALVDGEPADGAIAFPETAPNGLVVFAHGYGHSSASWLGHLRMAADELGLVAVAMDYRGTENLPEPGSFGGTRGWQVREGAADSNAAATAILTACGDVIDEVTLLGVSMGANAAGLALAANPTRPDTGAPLYDWWLNLEGAANAMETYLEARSLAASGNAFANNAVADIERQNGGPIEDVPEAYLDLAVVTHADEIAASGVKGVWHVHGAEDGLVPYNQSRELFAVLREAGMVQQFVTVLRRDPDGADPDQAQTNLTDYALNPIDPSYESPFAGHGSESSADNDIMAAGFARLRALVLDDDAIDSCYDGLLDGGAFSSLGYGCPS